MLFKSRVWFRNRDGDLRGHGDLLDPAYEAMGAVDAAHKALHRAPVFVRNNVVSVEVIVCVKRERNYPPGRDPYDYGGTKDYPALALLGEPA
ncbi:hypothetical protein FJ420_02040 [Mesorhizobium sp. B3-1-3]|uniref:hypothetical protein n=1 Tax=unclassified Mesorhizobium TaxID=325217 RepID=UPI001126B414|nr:MULTISPECIES: hypothetical protein [unclassified Mesorhizobium]TPI67611.1 hypothetical protein FJ424_10010 [Mesorhizobium sp. B3-1-8]TPI75657.1 hypothetical protein FJ420_02040 [Mesorhizobium sp. B3-1-3]